MANPFPPGRMLRKDISRSHRIAKLSPKAFSLFCLIIPHLNSYGKMNGDPLYIKAECAPLTPWLTPSTIKKCLREINEHTNVKWFEYKGCWYLHALSWKEHQDLREERLGQDHLPSFAYQVPDQSRSSPGVVPPEVEVEVEGEGEEEVEVKNKEEEKEKKELSQKCAAASAGVLEAPASAAYTLQKQNRESVNINSSKKPEPTPRLTKEESLEEIRTLHKQRELTGTQVSSRLREAGFSQKEIVTELIPQYFQKAGETR